VQAQGPQDRLTGRCPACRGHGWLNVRSRPVYRSAAFKLTGVRLPRETCWDCSEKAGWGDEYAARRAARPDKQPGP
jgi:hypothetical protein